MSTAAVTGSIPNEGVQAYFQQRQSDLKQLGQDLKSGDLTDAQQEYSAIQTLAQNGPFANGDAFYRSDRQQDFNALGQALQSGDLAAAQQAFSQLKGTFHAHGNSGAPVSTTLASTTPAATTQSSSTSTGPEIILNLANAPAGEQITIDLNNTGNGNEQVTVSAANSQNPTPEQVTFNLNLNSNAQVTLNLFNSATTTSTQGSAVNVSA